MSTKKVPQGFLRLIKNFLRDERGEVTPGGDGGTGDNGKGDGKGNESDGGKGSEGNPGAGGDGGQAGTKTGAAGSENGGKGDEGGSKVKEPSGLDGLDSGTQKYIKDLRSENARYRTEAKESKSQVETLTTRFGKMESGLKSALGIEGNDDLSPEDKAKGYESALHEQQFDSAIKDIAIENSLNTQQADYLGYIVGQKSNSLDEGQELSDELMGECVKQAKAIGGSQASGSGTTSVAGQGNDNGDGGDDSSKTPNNGAGGAVTTDQFVQMGMTAKTDLYVKNPTLYDKLLADAKTKSLL